MFNILDWLVGMPTFALNKKMHQNISCYKIIQKIQTTVARKDQIKIHIFRFLEEGRLNATVFKQNGMSASCPIQSHCR